jgi:protein TonB
MRSMPAAFAVLLLSGAAIAQESPQEVTRRTNGEIQFANYPRGSLARGEQGTVGIDVTTDGQGRLRSCAVSKSSGFPALDEATCDLLISHLKMKPWLAPNGGGVVKRQQGQIIWALPIDYKGPIAKPAASIAFKAKSDDPNRKICRPQTTTGSLIASTRICLTRAQWQQQYLHAQEETRDMHPKFLPGN